MRGKVLQIIQQASVELGLPVPQTAIGGTDLSTLQMIALLNAVGADLVLIHDWNELTKVGQITSVANQSVYPLPADYQRVINGTMWNSAQLGFTMPTVTPQQWQFIKNSSLGSQINSQWRVVNGAMWITPTPANSNMSMTFEYQSSSWLELASAPDTYGNLITSDLDVPVFDFWLMVKLLKVKMWIAKGLDYSALASEAQGVMASLIGGNNPSPVLSLSPRAFLVNPNTPEGSWNA